LENPENTMVYYVMLRGVDRFYSEYNLYPGEFEDQVEPDIVKLKVWNIIFPLSISNTFPRVSHFAQKSMP
jgi:amyloid beta precursor protein binding protein 1